MIRSAVVEGFRGLQRLEVGGLARVNLVIGKNDCGKTALMEALLIGADVDVARNVLHVQELRKPGAPVEDFDRFWKPLFASQNVERGFSISTTNVGGNVLRATLRKAAPATEVVGGGGRGRPLKRRLWQIDVAIEQDGRRSESQIVATTNGVEFPPVTEPGGIWIEASKNLSSYDIRLFSKLRQAARDAELLDILAQIDERVTGVELLAPGGADAQLFVRFQRGAPLLLMTMMGDGFQRCFEIGVAVLADDRPQLYVDELDNGLHHSVLEPVWRWIATMSARRNLQVFATTHSEECIQAACGAFTALNDDGLRVIRLDRREQETVATVYDRAMVEAATRMDVEIRG